MAIPATMKRGMRSTMRFAMRLKGEKAMKVDCPWCKVEMLRVDDLVYKVFYDFTNLKATCSGWRCPKCGREMFDRKSLLNANLTIDAEKEEENGHSTD